MIPLIEVCNFWVFCTFYFISYSPRLSQSLERMKHPNRSLVRLTRLTTFPVLQLLLAPALLILSLLPLLLSPVLLCRFMSLTSLPCLSLLRLLLILCLLLLPVLRLSLLLSLLGLLLSPLLLLSFLDSLLRLLLLLSFLVPLLLRLFLSPSLGSRVGFPPFLLLNFPPQMSSRSLELRRLLLQHRYIRPRRLLKGLRFPKRHGSKNILESTLCFSFLFTIRQITISFRNLFAEDWREANPHEEKTSKCNTAWTKLPKEEKKASRSHPSNLVSSDVQLQKYNDRVKALVRPLEEAVAVRIPSFASRFIYLIRHSYRLWKRNRWC